MKHIEFRELFEQPFHFKEDTLTIKIPKGVKDHYNWCILPVMTTNIVSNMQILLL